MSLNCSLIEKKDRAKSNLKIIHSISNNITIKNTVNIMKCKYFLTVASIADFKIP